ncbi:hypothetical protein BVRB_023910, partial [Beta vulgaris subsp. vulgaris]
YFVRTPILGGLFWSTTRAWPDTGLQAVAAPGGAAPGLQPGAATGLQSGAASGQDRGDLFSHFFSGSGPACVFGIGSLLGCGHVVFGSADHLRFGAGQAADERQVPAARYRQPLSRDGCLKSPNC